VLGKFVDTKLCLQGNYEFLKLVIHDRVEKDINEIGCMIISITMETLPDSLSDTFCRTFLATSHSFFLHKFQAT
jgi:hypothetical protein